MNRRSFLQTLPAAAIASATSPSLRAQAAPTECGGLAFAAPAAIDGPLARGLMPPMGQPPLPQSARYKGLRFTGRQRIYSESIGADTWYPAWAADGSLYSSYTDGSVKDAQGRPIRANSQWEDPEGLHERWFRDLGITVRKSALTTQADKRTSQGHARLDGDDPFALRATPLPPFSRASERYEGYYPCANLLHDDIWYYGGYYCHRWLNHHSVPITYELGGFGGFRISRDLGLTWQDSPHDDRSPLFPETGRCSGGAPIRMGTPHFVDFGRNLEHSTDGYAYLAGHGAYTAEGVANWSSGDAVSLARIKPSPESINNPAAWEFYAGNSPAGPVWTSDFSRIAPILEWPGGAGCVNITWQPALKRYFGFLCGGWADGDAGCYNLWVVESESLTGPWSTVACLRASLGGQPYFVCMPGKFNRSADSKLILFYSANWRADRAGVPSWKDTHGPDGAYSLCVAEFELLG